jgi:hypothetical protein
MGRAPPFGSCSRLRVRCGVQQWTDLHRPGPAEARPATYTWSVHPFSASRYSGLLRIRASLLLALFLAAGTSLPSLDALVYHGLSSEAAKSQTHLEPAGGCLNHAEHCGLGRTAPGSGSVVLAGAKPRREPPPSHVRPTRPVPPESSNAAVVTPPSRAPPAPSA